MGSLSIMLVILISYGIFRVVKDLFSHFSHPDSNPTTAGQVSCPYCKTKQVIPHEGLLTCQTCKKGFEVQHGITSNLNHVLSQELTLVVMIFAKLAKADGWVTKKEIRVVDHLIKTHYQPTERQLFKIREVFNSAKLTSTGYESLLHKLHAALPRHSDSRLTFLHSLFQLGHVDGGLHNRQETLIMYAVKAFKVDAKAYAAIKSIYVNDLDSHYRLLNCSKTDSLETIKKNYRRLIKEHHPDRYMNQNMSPDFIALMNQRIHDIHRAYKVITRYRKAN